MSSPGREAAMPQRTVLRESVKDIVLRRILDGEYPPGSRLVETRIAQELGISQAPVREALRDLEQLGAVVHAPFRGCSVRELSVAELLEAFPVRAALESLAARMAATRMGEQDIDRLAELLDDMSEAAAVGDRSAEAKTNAAFHETIVRAAGNATLERQWRQLQPHARTSISLMLPAGELTATAWQRHHPIFEALRRRDPDAAAAACHVHLMQAAERMRASAELTNGKETA